MFHLIAVALRFAAVRNDVAVARVSETASSGLSRQVRFARTVPFRADSIVKGLAGRTHHTMDKLSLAVRQIVHGKQGDNVFYWL
jgi:hypothetical protein